MFDFTRVVQAFMWGSFSVSCRVYGCDTTPRRGQGEQGSRAGFLKGGRTTCHWGEGLGSFGEAESIEIFRGDILHLVLLADVSC